MNNRFMCRPNILKVTSEVGLKQQNKQTVNQSIKQSNKQNKEIILWELMLRDIQIPVGPSKV